MKREVTFRAMSSINCEHNSDTGRLLLNNCIVQIAVDPQLEDDLYQRGDKLTKDGIKVAIECCCAGIISALRRGAQEGFFDEAEQMRIVRDKMDKLFVMQGDAQMGYNLKH